MGIEEVDWDGVVALAYTAEQLFSASQLLTSDTVPADRALRIARAKHISTLLEYHEFLPASIVDKLNAAHQACTEAERKDMSMADARQLSRQVLTILHKVSLDLNELDHRRRSAA